MILALTPSTVSGIVQRHMRKHTIDYNLDAASAVHKIYFPYRIEVMTPAANYAQTSSGKTLHVYGPQEHLPNFVVAADKQQKERIEQEASKKNSDHVQKQLMLSNGIYINRLELNGDEFNKNLEIKDIGSIYFSTDFSPKTRNSTYLPLPAKELRIYLDKRLAYFLRDDVWRAGSYAVFFQNDAGREELLQAIENHVLVKTA